MPCPEKRILSQPLGPCFLSPVIASHSSSRARRRRGNLSRFLPIYHPEIASLLAMTLDCREMPQSPSKGDLLPCIPLRRTRRGNHRGLPTALVSVRSATWPVNRAVTGRLVRESPSLTKKCSCPSVSLQCQGYPRLETEIPSGHELRSCTVLVRS